MNVRTEKTGLDLGSWIVDVPFKTGLFGLLSLYPLRFPLWRPSIAIMIV